MTQVKTQTLPSADARAEVEALLQLVRPKLPIQNPLFSFVHNNTLLNFEAKPFQEALREAAQLYGARPYPDEAFFRRRYSEGRILPDDLKQALQNSGSTAESCHSDLQDFLKERPRSEAKPASHWTEHQKKLREELLVPLIAAWLDQGMADLSHPFREAGLWRFFCEYVLHTPDWSREGHSQLRELIQAAELKKQSPEDWILAELDQWVEASGQPSTPESKSQRILQSLFQLKGWSGMLQKFEAEPEQAPVQVPGGALREWVAIQLLCDRWMEAERVRLHPEEPSALSPSPHSHSRLDRLAIWQDAYERRFQQNALRILAPEFQRQAGLEQAKKSTPQLQAIFCIDDREESLRRHLEKALPEIQTFGAAGFFGIDMRFQAHSSSRAKPQCPPVVQPSRLIFEKLQEPSQSPLRLPFHSLLRPSWWRLQSLRSTRRLAPAAASSLLLGAVSHLGLFLQILFPRTTHLFANAIARRLSPQPLTRLELEGPEGYSIEDQAGIVGSLLRMIGLTSEFAPAVVLVAHGSSQTNNPFLRAYGCGACSGHSGAPNARAFTMMANHPQVREILATQGLKIPESTRFFGAYHDTCSEDFEFVPDDDSQKNSSQDASFDSSREAIARFKKALPIALGKNALERSRRFGLIPDKLTEKGALAHAKWRSLQPAQPRAEYGHARVALCVVGRRELTRSLDLDRRAFLVSYDSRTDVDGRALRDAVHGAVPVTANIALDYYFSRVDNEHFGAGSKLPLNVTGLLGVMTGSKGDLRIGLPRQTVEIHEPMRIFVLIEATEERLHDVIFGRLGSARMARLVNGDWMTLGRIHPEDGSISLWKKDRFVPWSPEPTPLGVSPKPFGLSPSEHL